MAERGMNRETAEIIFALSMMAFNTGDLEGSRALHGAAAEIEKRPLEWRGYRDQARSDASAPREGEK